VNGVETRLHTHIYTNPESLALPDLSIQQIPFQPSVASLHPQEMRESNGVLASSHFEAGKYRIKRNHQAAKVLQVTVILNIWWVTIPPIDIDPENSPCLEDSSLPIPFWQGLY